MYRLEKCLRMHFKVKVLSRFLRFDDQRLLILKQTVIFTIDERCM